MTNGQPLDNKYKGACLELAIGLYSSEEKTLQTIEKLIKEKFPADQLSLLRKAGGTGVGLAYTNTKERVKAWGKHGVVWGVLWGMSAGTTGLFVLPGLGPLLAVGPVVDALGEAIAGVVAPEGSGVLTQLASALHSIGVPASAIKQIHRAIETDHYVIILQCDSDQASHCAMRLGSVGADSVIVMPGEH